MVRVVFSASGFGTTVCEYADEESARAAIRADAREVAGEHGGVVREDGIDTVATRPDGGDIARWELRK